MILNISISIEEFKERYTMFPMGKLKLSPKEVQISYVARTQGALTAIASSDEELYAKLVTNGHLVSLELPLMHRMKFMPKAVIAKSILGAIEFREAFEKRTISLKELSKAKKKQYFITER